MPLTDMALRKALSKDKDYKLYDEKCLYAFIKSGGRKYWYVKYTKDNKRKEKMIGKYPDMSLKEARKKRDEIKKCQKEYIDPFAELPKKDKHYLNKIKESLLKDVAGIISKEIKTAMRDAITESRIDRPAQPTSYSTLPAWRYYTIKQIIGDKNSNPPIEPIIPISKSSWYLGIKNGIYPKPIKVGKRISLWLASDILNLMNG